MKLIHELSGIKLICVKNSTQSTLVWNNDVYYGWMEWMKSRISPLCVFEAHAGNLDDCSIHGHRLHCALRRAEMNKQLSMCTLCPMNHFISLNFHFKVVDRNQFLSTADCRFCTITQLSDINKIEWNRKWGIHPRCAPSPAAVHRLLTAEGCWFDF